MGKMERENKWKLRHKHLLKCFLKVMDLIT